VSNGRIETGLDDDLEIDDGNDDGVADYAKRRGDDITAPVIFHPLPSPHEKELAPMTFIGKTILSQSVLLCRDSIRRSLSRKFAKKHSGIL